MVVSCLTSVWVMHARAQMKVGQMLVAADLADAEMDRVLAEDYFAVQSSEGSFEQVWEIRGETIVNRYDVEVRVIAFIFLGHDFGVKFIRVDVHYDLADGTDKKAIYRLDTMKVRDG